MKLKNIPNELLAPWYERFEKLYLVPAIPRCSGGWTYGFGASKSIFLGFGEYGYCQVIPESEDELYLFFIYIAPEFRCQGHGKSYMKEIIQISQEIGYKRIGLDVGYLNPKDRIPVPILRKFYKSFGFKGVKGTTMSLEITQPSNILANSKL
ncbi:MAG: hypothetical protein DRQ39_06645 [Gammaproteobacteria bacterium]|nr:MAG: hypothetical protein DRQ39_06645 [Gammaproteobacteria bacterium]